MASLNVYCNRVWSVVQALLPDWLFLDRLSGNGDDVIDVTVAPNTGADTRNATIMVVTQDGQDSATCQVSQTGELLSLSPVEAEIPAAGTIPLDLVLTCNTPWTISSDQAWLVLSQESGIGNATLQATASENTGGVRVATITATNGNLTATCVVTQAEAAGLLNFEIYNISGPGFLYDVRLVPYINGASKPGGTISPGQEADVDGRYIDANTTSMECNAFIQFTNSDEAVNMIALRKFKMGDVPINFNLENPYIVDSYKDNDNFDFLVQIGTTASTGDTVFITSHKLDSTAIGAGTLIGEVLIGSPSVEPAYISFRVFFKG